MTHIRAMNAADVSFCLQLSRRAGWNQTEAVWQRAIDLQPDGCFLAEREGRVIGTATACMFGRVAWVAMVLVDASVRRQGIARALMEHILEFLDGQDVATIRL